MMVTPLAAGQGRKLAASPVKKNGGIKQSPLQLQPQKMKNKHDLQEEALEFPSGAKSPIKKHLKNAAMTKWESTPATPTQPQPTATRAQVPAKQETHKQTPATPVSSAAKMATLRASIIQVMLGLLDQDQDTVQGTIPILQALATLPLENLSVRHECLQMLQRLYELSFSPSKQHQHQSQGHDPRFDAVSDIPTSEGDGDNDRDRAGSIMPPSFVYKYDDVPSSAPTNGRRGGRSMKDSGRAKSLSLHHCKEFLLACANEIHELEDENPNFDYAEDTSSETTSGGLRRYKNSTKTVTTMLEMLASRSRFSNGNGKRRVTDFDYASTAASSASIATGIALTDDMDDLHADQGSEFSEVVRRADYLSDFDDGDDEADGNEEEAAKQRAIRELASVRDRVLCRQALHQLQKMEKNPASPLSSSPRELLLLKHRVFTALKQNGLQSRRNASRKRLAFQFLKANLQQMRLKRSMMQKLRVAASRSSAKTSSNRLSRKNKKTQQAPPSNTARALAMAPLDRNTHVKMLLSQHLDLVFVVLCAIFMQSMLS